MTIIELTKIVGLYTKWQKCPVSLNVHWIGACAFGFIGSRYVQETSAAIWAQTSATCIRKLAARCAPEAKAEVNGEGDAKKKAHNDEQHGILFEGDAKT